MTTVHIVLSTWTPPGPAKSGCPPENLVRIDSVYEDPLEAKQRVKEIRSTSPVFAEIFSHEVKKKA